MNEPSRLARAAMVALVLGSSRLLALADVTVTDLNVDKVARTIEAGNTSDVRLRFSSTPPSQKILKRLARIPSQTILKMMTQSTLNRDWAAAILGYKGDAATFNAVRQAFVRGDISVDGFRQAIKLHRTPSLADELGSSILDTSLSCSKRQLLIDMLALHPSPASVPLIQRVFDSPELQRCDGYPPKLDREYLIDALGSLGRPEAISFLKSIPPCTSDDERFPGRTTANRMRARAIKALALIGGDAAFDVLVSWAKEESDCSDLARGTYTPDRYPWRAASLYAISEMKSLKPAQMQTLIQLDPGNAHLISALVRTGKAGVRQLDELFALPQCKTISVALEWIAAAADPSYLRGSETSSIISQLISGLAAGKDAQPKVWRVLRQQAPDCLSETNEKTTLIKAAGKIRDPAAVPSLAALVDTSSPDWRVQHRAVEALGNIGDRAAIEKLEAIFASDSPPNLRQPVREALGVARQRRPRTVAR